MPRRPNLECSILDKISSSADAPKMIADYCNGFPLSQLVIKYKVITNWDFPSQQSAVTALSRVMKKHLSTEQRAEIRKKHFFMGGVINGNVEVIIKDGIHHLSEKQKVEVRKKAAEANGYHVWTAKEKKYFLDLEKDMQGKNWGKYNILSKKIEEKFGFIPNRNYLYKLRYESKK